MLKPTSAVIYFCKIIGIFNKNYLEKPIVMFLLMYFIVLFAKLKVKVLETLK